MTSSIMRHNQINLGFSVAPVIRSLQIPAMALSIDGQMVDVNQLARDALGLDDATLQDGINFAALLNRDDKVQFATLLNTVSQDLADIDQTYTLHWQGKATQFDVSTLRDTDGTLIGFLGQQSPDDITQELLAWRNALSSSDHGLWEIDVPTATCTFSDDWYRMRGRSRDDTSVTALDSLFDRVHPEDCDRLQLGIMAIFANESDTFSIEFRERHADGHDIWILSRGRVVARDADGQPLRFVGTDTDITQPKTSAHLIEDLTRREVRWKVAIEGAEQGVWDNDMVNDMPFVSETWRRLRGIPDDAETDHSLEKWLSEIHPDDVAHVRAELARQASGETDTINYQYRQRHYDGHWIWILSRGRVVRRTADGKPARVIGTDTDITDIKKVEEEHQQMSERLRVAMVAADMGRWEFNVRETEAYWDDRLLEMFGVTHMDNRLPGDFWATLIHPDDQERAFQISEDSVARGVDLALDYRICRPDGEIVHVRSRAVFVADPKNGDRFVGVNIDITEDIRRQEELEAARAQLEYEAHHDALTGLINRRGVDALQSEMLRDVEGQRQAILHFDLDKFKHINDTLGHGAGDAVLVHAADILRNVTEKDWCAARIGGDEFVILIPDAPSDAALKSLANAVIEQVAKPFIYDGQHCNFGVSIGIAVADVDQAPDASLFVSADLALYAAKKDGRGRSRFFDARMKKSAAARKNAFDALLNGFEAGEIICHYQPQFDAQTLQLTGLEALVRWDSREHGLMMPDAFLDTVEEMGMLAQFDALVLQNAHRDLMSWQSADLDVPQISVNVSSARLSDPNLASTLRDMDLPRGKFAFELLESAFLDSFDDSLSSNLAALRNMGIDIEIDDFGTGHASIVSLLRVEPHRLKIDRQLIAPIIESARQRNLIKTIISIGQMQGVAVVAEGVETAQHAKILKTLGCDYLQGFALGRPADFDHTTNLLRLLSTNAGRLILAA